MAPGALLTGPSQIEWAEELLFGDVGSGIVYEVVRLTGWSDLPDVDLGNVPYAGEHGARPGSPRAQQRVVTVDFNTIRPRGAASTEAVLEAVEDATPIRAGERTLVVRSFSGKTLMAYGVVQRRALPMEQGYRRRVEGCAIVWVCADPRRYAMSEQSVSIPAPTPGTGGLPFPIEYPLDFGTPGTPGLGVAENLGNVDTFPRVVFTGPMEGPSLTNFLTGARISFDVELDEGETLVVDCRADTAVAGGATVLPQIGQQSVPLRAFTFEPGETPLVFNADSFPEGGAPGCVVSWRSAWW